MNITPLESDKNYDAGELYSVISETTTHSNKFNSTVINNIIKLKEIHKDPHSVVKWVFNKLLEAEMKEIDQHAKVGTAFSNDTYLKPLFIQLWETGTLNFFNTCPASLPKMFNSAETVKRYFPHYFNRQENYDYIGLIPEARYCGPDEMEFSAW